MLLIDIMGWLGGFLILLAFAMISTGRLDRYCLSYHLINIIGAILLIINTAYLKAYPSMAVNIVWVAVGFYGILNRKKGENSKILC